MIVLDTTVLVYATGSEHALRGPCRRLLEAVSAGSVDATTTVEVVQEFVHVRGRRRPRPEAVRLGLAWADLLSPLLEVSETDLRAGLALHRDVPALGAFDAVLAAAAQLRRADALVSADRAFADVEGLTAVAPDEEGIARLLGP